MKYTVWSAGILVLLFWTDYHLHTPGSSAWPLFLAVVYWTIHGVIIGILGILKIVGGRMGAGDAGGLFPRLPQTPTPPKGA